MNIITGILPTETNMEIGLLIGANCLKALEPEEVLPSKDSEPLAFRTTLGWCVVGVLTKFRKKSSISCNRIVKQDAATGKIVSQYFGISSKVKDSNTKQMLKNIYNAEFCESRLGLGIEASNNMEDTSLEGQKIWKFMNEKLRKVGEHFEMPLPLKDSQ